MRCEKCNRAQISCSFIRSWERSQTYFFDLYIHFSFKLSLIRCTTCGRQLIASKGRKCIESTVVRWLKRIKAKAEQQIPTPEPEPEPEQYEWFCASFTFLHNRFETEWGARSQRKIKNIDTKTDSYFHPEDVFGVRSAHSMHSILKDQTKKGVKPCSVDCIGSTNGK